MDNYRLPMLARNSKGVPMKYLMAAIILSTGIVGHFDSEPAHVAAAIDNAEPACHTTLDEYLAVTLNARRK